MGSQFVGTSLQTWGSQRRLEGCRIGQKPCLPQGPWQGDKAPGRTRQPHRKQPGLRHCVRGVPTGWQGGCSQSREDAGSTRGAAGLQPHTHSSSSAPAPQALGTPHPAHHALKGICSQSKKVKSSGLSQGTHEKLRLSWAGFSQEQGLS